jgi:hypothetical protein
MDLRRGEMDTAINTKHHFTSLTSDEMQLPIIIAAFVCVVISRSIGGAADRMTNGLKRLITARIGWFYSRYQSRGHLDSPPYTHLTKSPRSSVSSSPEIAWWQCNIALGIELTYAVLSNKSGSAVNGQINRRRRIK